MAMCLRSQASSDDDAEHSSPQQSPVYFSCSPGDSDVCQQESAFGSFTSFPADSNSSFQTGSTYTRNVKWSSSSRSSHPSSSSDSSNSTTTRQGSVKRLFKRSISLIVKSKSDYELSSLYSSEFSEPFYEIKDSILHVYRTNTLPQQGLCRFQETLAEFVFSGGGEPVDRWWKGEVLPAGTRMLAVTVASPKNGDRIGALLNSWHLLYTTILPLLQALLSPLNNLNVRGDVLEAFRDTVLPYAGIAKVLNSETKLSRNCIWKLKQMLLVLARLGPCRCHLRSKRHEEKVEEEEDEKSPATSNQMLSGSKVTSQHSNPNLEKEYSVPFAWDGHNVNEILYLLLEKMEDRNMGVSAPLMEQILHLHHGGRRDFDSNYLRQVSKLQRHERVPSPGHWLTRSPTSCHTLEELLRSAASR